MAAPDMSGQFNRGKPSAFMPTIEEITPQGRIITDPFSRLARQQSIYLFEEVNNQTSAIIVAQLFSYLNDGDKSTPIKFYIQSPGGSIYDGEAVIDAMEKLKEAGFTIETYAVGLSMSMGSQFLVAGSKGHRWALPNSTIMLHEPASTGSGHQKAEDQINSATESAYLKTRTAMRYAAYTNMSYEQALKIITGPDYFMRAEEAVDLGVVDKIDYPIKDKELAASLKFLNNEHYRLHKEAQSVPGLLTTAPDFKKPAVAVPVPAANLP